ncbi:general secretion pathway protein GspM [Pseudomonas sp. S35]|uniref:type II secretion system protein GspM n=1 Tax=Pseudomonas sp. S35 TaxID=1573719 RepID=UPI00132EB144|nr:type II secretion system protein GspM [Pseudomonas sp. S35]QHF45068.1 general secretion pathway protein GspM [Pseudomonas sp. S35]
MNKQSLILWRGQWQYFNARARVFWRGLSLREKRLVAGTALLLGGLLSWLVLIQPPLKKIDYWQAETPKLRAQTQALERLLREVPIPHAGQPLEPALRQSLDTHGLAARYQLKPLDNGWQLTFDAAPADAVIGWLVSNPRQFSLEVVEARLQRANDAKADDTAGTLSGTVRMDQALGAKEAS